jgi:hypothetical protein
VVGMNMHTDHVSEIRRTLVDPVRVCDRLGLARDAKLQAAGLLIRCPMHIERTPSCSVTRAGDGTVRVRCFGCDWSADVLGLVAAARGLDARRDFREVLLAAAEVGGLREVAAELAGTARPTPRGAPPLPVPPPERPYPDQAEVFSVWNAARPIAEVEACHTALALRGLFPGPDAARALEQPPGPRWARYQGASWFETGHRIVLPAFDARGALRSLRAWQVDRNAPGPKRLPPAGYRATGLVLANAPALHLLGASAAPARLLIAEGEPDHLSLCQRYPGVAVIGVVSGSWSEMFAARIPIGSLVTIRTHQDAAGDRYADTITKTLAGRALIKRGAA